MTGPASHGDILLAGASGLVGGLLAKRLAPARLVCIGRRTMPGLPEGVRQIVADPKDWAHEIARLNPAIAISVLGTTIRNAGSQAGFFAIDHDLVLNLARASREAGACQFLMVSSVGAAADSRNFYLSTKGKVEAAVCGLGYDRVDILRPGLLRGDRQERRPGERIAIALSPLTDLLTPRALDKYRSIAAVDVAGALAALCGAEAAGLFIHHNREMSGGIS
ncbi:MAG: NAD-dependent epimerase/dehydratase family protein [Sphingomonadales bacterium]|nr:NAD-dependent epimerase/dehydratase family protein [Sphingomonadales bacterium]